MPPPPKHHKPEKRPPHRQVPASRSLRFVDPASLDVLLSPLIPSKEDREFVQRCLIDEGPLHHRGANYLLLRLLGRVLERVPGVDAPLEGERVPMRLPPHLEDEVEEGSFIDPSPRPHRRRRSPVWGMLALGKPRPASTSARACWAGSSP
jgi:hypothetical protein